MAVAHSPKHGQDLAVGALALCIIDQFVTRRGKRGSFERARDLFHSRLVRMAVVLRTSRMLSHFHLLAG
jgi:hypothetical protein